MNLRDQLMKAGIASKKQADAAAREARKDQKVHDGNLEGRRVLERREVERLAAEHAAHEAERYARRKEAQDQAERETVLWQGRQLLRAHRVSYRPGPQRFWHVSPDRREAWKLWLPERLAADLRGGKGGICWIDGGSEPEIVLVDRATVERVRAVRPELVLFFNEEPAGVDPAEQLSA